MTLAEVIGLHLALVGQPGGAAGVRDLGALESALAQPQLTFEGRDIYPTSAGKASALCYFLIQNHPFVDGDERFGHAAMEAILMLDDHELTAIVYDTEHTIVGWPRRRRTENRRWTGCWPG